MTTPATGSPTDSPTSSFRAPSQHWFPVPYPYGDRNQCDRAPPPIPATRNHTRNRTRKETPMNPAPHADRDHEEQQPTVIAPIPRPCRGCGVGEAQRHTDDCPAVIEAATQAATPSTRRPRPYLEPAIREAARSIVNDLQAAAQSTGCAHPSVDYRACAPAGTCLDCGASVPLDDPEPPASSDPAELRAAKHWRLYRQTQADLDGLRAQLEVATTARRLAEAEVERLRAFNVQLAEGNAERLHRAVEREEAAKVNGLRLAEQLAKVRALADEWARGYNSPTPAPHADRDGSDSPIDLLAHLGQAIARARDGMTGKTTPSDGTSPVDPLRVEEPHDATEAAQGPFSRVFREGGSPAPGHVGQAERALDEAFPPGGEEGHP